jgi:hypothetical protein
MKHAVLRLWAGDVPLGQAVWTYAVVYGLLINAVSSFLTFALFAKDAPAIFGLAALVAPIPYNVLVVIGVWRSADRYEGPSSEAEIARFATIAWMILLSVV